MEYYVKYCVAKKKPLYEQYLKNKIEDVDVLCVQEDLLFWSDQFLEEGMPFGDFNRLISSTDRTDIKYS